MDTVMKPKISGAAYHNDKVRFLRVAKALSRRGIVLKFKGSQHQMVTLQIWLEIK